MVKSASSRSAILVMATASCRLLLCAQERGRAQRKCAAEKRDFGCGVFSVRDGAECVCVWRRVQAWREGKRDAKKRDFGPQRVRGRAGAAGAQKRDAEKRDFDGALAPWRASGQGPGLVHPKSRFGGARFCPALTA